MYHFSTHNSSICAVRYRDTVVSLSPFLPPSLSLGEIYARDITVLSSPPLCPVVLRIRTRWASASASPPKSDLVTRAGYKEEEKKERTRDGVSALSPFANSTHACPRARRLRADRDHPEYQATRPSCKDKPSPGSVARGGEAETFRRVRILLPHIRLGRANPRGPMMIKRCEEKEEIEFFAALRANSD